MPEEVPMPIRDDRFTIDQIKNAYLFGIDLSDTDGKEFPQELMAHHLNSAITHLEAVLDVVIPETEITENHDFFANDYQNWGYLKLFKKPVKEVKRLSMMYGNNESVVIPNDWIKLSKASGDITLFPSHGSAAGMIISSSGAFVGLFNRWQYAPGLWKVTYNAGMDVIPEDVKEFVYKKACINILQVWGDLIIGAGIASQSISMDGLSQSIGTTQSAMFGGASARIKEYRDDLDKILPVLRSRYAGITMLVV